MKKPAPRPSRKPAAKPRRATAPRARTAPAPMLPPRSVALELLLTPGCDCALCGRRNPWRD